MQLLTIDQLQPGMLLGKDIVNEQGRPLLAKGSRFTAAYIRSLRGRGYETAWVMNGVADDIEPPDILPPEVRVSTRRHLQELSILARKAGQEESDRDAAIQSFASAARLHMADIFRDVQDIVDEVADNGTISGIVRLKNQEGYGAERAVEVAAAAVLFGSRLYLDLRDLEGLALGCLLLDLGNLAVPSEILDKPARLSPEELEVARSHTELGYEIARGILGDSDITARHVVRQHHERQDGRGYPQQLRGSNSMEIGGKRRFGQGLIIPAAEIAAVADVYTALASDRPYRRGMAPHQIVATMRQMAGTHLNSELVTRFLSILPAFPVLTQVVVVSGKLKEYRGVVARINSRDIHRPVVRILLDPYGRDVRPFEVDTSAEWGIEIAVSPHPLFAPAATA